MSVKPLNSIERPFHYSGNKKAVLKKCEFDTPECKRIVEPFMGAACFSISSGKEWLGIDLNPDVVLMMEWLKTVDESRLWELKEYEGKRVSVKDLPISDVEKTYMRINISGAYVGQLNSWIIYTQHKLPVNDTIKCLPGIRRGSFYCGDAFSYKPQDGDLVFIDPPYINTQAGYKSKGKQYGYVNPSMITEFIKELGVPWIFTYGQGAKEIFPDFDWKEVYTRRVPNIRMGGTVERTEHICFSYEANYRTV
jgi:site-specific DNA-adenine methylase